MIACINKAITELVYPKYKLQKAYNYYNGVRDAEQFRALEENFGLGNPTSIEFIPLIRKHIDALIGEYLETPILPKVTCKDTGTLTNIARDKHLKIVKEVFNYLKAHLNNSILAFIDGKNITDKAVESQLKKIISDIDKNYISEYEIAAQNVLEYIMQSRNTDLTEKLKTLFKDLLITGYAYYRVKPSPEGNNIDIEVLNPLNVFIDKNPESIYIKNSYRAVVRKWLSKTQILNKYGEIMDKDTIKELEDLYEGIYDNSTYYVRTFTNQATGYPATDGIDAGQEIVPGFPADEYRITNYKLIPVYEVEWTETRKEDGKFVMDRYEGVRIGESIFIHSDISQNVVRTKDNPSFCTLSTSGIYYSTRSAEAYSLVLACANLQDKYDVLHFYRDSLIANSGTSGDWLDLSMLPTVLGADVPERLQKWLGYKKGGVALIDTSQEGRAFNNNTSFAGFDDTIKAPTIQAIELAIERTENTCSSITGVFRERLNGIEQHDAVSNVKVGIKNSFTVTKQYYQQMDLLTNELLIDCLNTAKIVYKKGITGALILGDKGVKVFTALPEYFTVTDFDIHIASSTNVIQDMELIKQLIPEFIKAGNVDPSIIVEAITSRSLTELKTNVSESLKKQREENNIIAQLQQQVEQLTQELQQAQNQLQQAQSKIESLNEAKLQLEKAKLESESGVNWYKAKADKKYKEGTIENDSKRVELEVAQMYDGNMHNNKVKY
nr:MAG TPA: portal protein [Caudoviricetes sp.]